MLTSSTKKSTLKNTKLEKDQLPKVSTKKYRAHKIYLRTIKKNQKSIFEKFDENLTRIRQKFYKKNLYRIKTVYLTNKDSTKRLRTHYHFSKKVQ